jgi:hypothetical protein
MENNYLYILVRTDLPSMRYGKGVAQGAHAANLFTDEHVIQPLLKLKQVNKDVMAWRESADGFGTTISLDIDGPTMDLVVDAARKLKFPAGIVVDPSYPYIVDAEVAKLIPESVHTIPPVYLPNDTVVLHRREATTAYIFGDKDELSVLLRRFKLLDNS